MIAGLNLRAAAAALGGEMIGTTKILCPGPGHSPKDRSLSVTFAIDGSFIVNSFAHDLWQDCREHVKARLGIQGEPSGYGMSRRPDNLESNRRRLDSMPPVNDFWKTVWRETKPLSGTPGALHLEQRGVDYDGDAVRWHSNCPFGKDRVGCMVALVRNIITDRPQAVHRTAIDDRGKKLSQLGSNGRLSLGPVKGGAVKLTDDVDVERVVAIGEGIETSLSIRRLPGLEQMPIWSLLSAQGIASFPILRGIETVWIAADHDVSGTGQREAQSLARRLEAAGTEAIVVKPHMAGSDLNDVIADPRHG